MPNRDVRLFWELADPMLAAGEATKGTMMGHPCLRAGGAFFATAGHDGDELIVKLPAKRVGQLIQDGTGEPFAPAGRRFREWVAISRPDRGLWQKLFCGTCCGSLMVVAKVLDRHGEPALVPAPCPVCRPRTSSRETWLAAVHLARRLAAGAQR